MSQRTRKDKSRGGEETRGDKSNHRDKINTHPPHHPISLYFSPSSRRSTGPLRQKQRRRSALNELEMSKWPPRHIKGGGAGNWCWNSRATIQGTTSSSQQISQINETATQRERERERERGRRSQE